MGFCMPIGSPRQETFFFIFFVVESHYYECDRRKKQKDAFWRYPQTFQEREVSSDPPHGISCVSSHPYCFFSFSGKQSRCGGDFTFGTFGGHSFGKSERSGGRG